MFFPNPLITNDEAESLARRNTTTISATISEPSQVGPDSAWTSPEATTILTIVFGLVASITAVATLYASYRQWQVMARLDLISECPEEAMPLSRRDTYTDRPIVVLVQQQLGVHQWYVSGGS